MTEVHCRGIRDSTSIEKPVTSRETQMLFFILEAHQMSAHLCVLLVKTVEIHVGCLNLKDYTTALSKKIFFFVFFFFLSIDRVDTCDLVDIHETVT